MKGNPVACTEDVLQSVFRAKLVPLQLLQLQADTCGSLQFFQSLVLVGNVTRVVVGLSATHLCPTQRLRPAYLRHLFYMCFMIIQTPSRCWRSDQR